MYAGQFLSWMPPVSRAPEKVDNVLVHQSQIFQVKNNAVIAGFLAEQRFQLTHIVCVHSTAEIKYPLFVSYPRDLQHLRPTMI